MSVEVKICGLSTAAALTAAICGGARYVGFVFYPSSPRFILIEPASALAMMVPSTIKRVGLFVDPPLADLGALLERVPLDMLQLHGKETPELVGEIRRRFALPVIKAMPVSEPSDLRDVDAFAAVADRLLFDARAPADAERPGGNAIAFDWSLVKGLSCRIPWFLAGGLDAANIATAVRLSGAAAVDVSSGVETSPGEKSPEKIRQFLRAAKSIETTGATP